MIALLVFGIICIAFGFYVYMFTRSYIKYGKKIIATITTTEKDFGASEHEEDGKLCTISYEIDGIIKSGQVSCSKSKKVGDKIECLYHVKKNKIIDESSIKYNKSGGYLVLIIFGILLCMIYILYNLLK